MGKCYICGQAGKISFPERHGKCVINTCWGVGYYRSLQEAAACPSGEVFEALFLPSGAENGREAAQRSCDSCESGVRYFHRSCLDTGAGNRQFVLSSDHKIFRNVSLDLAQAALAGTSLELRDLRHHLCNECLLQVQGHLCVKDLGSTGATDSAADFVPTSDGSNYAATGSIRVYTREASDSIHVHTTSLSSAEEEQAARDGKRTDSTASKLKKSLRVKVSKLSGKGTSCITFTESRAGRQDITMSSRVSKLMNDDEQLKGDLDGFCSALFESVRAAEHRRDIGNQVRYCCLWADERGLTQVISSVHHLSCFAGYSSSSTAQAGTCNCPYCAA